MKMLSYGAIKGIFISVGTMAVVTTSVIAINANNSFKANDEKINLAQNEIVEAKNPSVLAEIENEVKESKTQLEEANKELEKAETEKENAKKEVIDAEDAVAKAMDIKKLAENEVQNAKTDEERNAALEKVKAANETLTKAEETKKSANEKVQNAEKAIETAKDNKKVAEERVQEAEVQNKNAVNEVQQNVQTEAKEEAKTENSTTTNNNNNNKAQNNNATVTNPSTNESKSLTDEQLKKMLDAAAAGEKLDREEYERAYTEKYGHAPEEEKHEVEFHFYSSLNPLTVRLYDHSNYYTTSKCGQTGSGCIWFAEFSCDLNQCVGFADTDGTLKADVVYAKRASIKEYTMKAPDARPGYRFKQWELISERKNTLYGKTGLAYKYIAVYEKIN